MIPVIKEMKKARDAAHGVVLPVFTFRMMSKDGEDLGVVARTRRTNSCALEVRGALAAAWRSKNNSEPPPGWLFVFDGVKSDAGV